jgi:hypothetical protein
VNRRQAIACGLALGALAMAGCGQSANRDAVRTVADRFYAALDQQDGSAACAQLSEDTVKQVEQDEKGSCPTAIAAVGLASSRVTRVEVFITNAKVDLANGASAFLEQTASGWKISAAGCRATDGDPKDRPLGCAVES